MKILILETIQTGEIFFDW